MHNTANAKVTNLQLIKWKNAIKNGARVTLRFSSNMFGTNSNSEEV